MQKLRPCVTALTAVPVCHSAQLVTTHRLSSSAYPFVSAANGVVSVRSKGYGPSKDLLKGIDPKSRVMIESKLHPEDLSLQRTVLALAMPSIQEISVVDNLDSHDYKIAPAEGLTSGIIPEKNPNLKATDALTRMELFESTLTEQLATVSNLIIRQICTSRKVDLDTMEASQSNEMRTLANLVIQCIRDELKDTLRSTLSTNAKAPSLPNVEDLSKRISQQVALSLEKQLQSNQTQEKVISTEVVEKKLSSYFEHLEASLKSAFTEFSAIQLSSQSDSGATSAQTGLSDEARDSILNTIEQSARLQHENLLNALEDSISTHFSKIDSRDNVQSAPKGIDVGALQNFIECSLDKATDDIRHSITAEIKKAMGKKSLEANKTNESSSNAWHEEMGAFSLSIDKAVMAAQNAFTRTEAVDEAIQFVAKDQKKIAQTMLDLKKLLQNELDTRHRDTTGGQPSIVDYLGEISPLIEDLKKSLVQFDASMEVRQGQTEDRLLSVAQVITESVEAAVEARTASVLTSAISTVDQQLQRIFEVIQSSQAKEEPAPIPPPPSRADIEAVVEAVLVPKVETFIAQLEGAVASKWDPDNMAHLANSISKSVSLVIEEEYRRREEQAANAPPPSSDRDDNLTESLDRLRVDLVSTVEQEMGKPHEVNLTPMYQYIDSILVFLKDSFATQETNLDRKVEELSKNLSTMMTDSIAAQTQEQLTKARQQEPLAISESSPEAREAMHADGQDGDARSEEALGKLTTTKSLKGFMEQVEASLAEAVAPLAASLSSRSTDDAAITSTITETAMTLRNQISAVEDSISRLSAHHHEDMASSLSNLLQTVDMKSVKEGLTNIQSVLGEQAATLESLRLSTDRVLDEKHGVEKSNSDEIAQRFLNFQTQVSNQFESFKTLLEKIDQTNQQQILTLVQQIQENILKLHEMNQKNQQQLEDTSASADTTPSEEVKDDEDNYEDVRKIVKEAVNEVLKGELVTSFQTIQQDLANLNESKESTKRELLTSIEGITKRLDEQKAIQSSAPPMLKKDDIELAISSHTENIKRLLESQSTNLLHDVSENLAIREDSVYTQISDTIKSTQADYEKKLHEGMEKSMGKQTQQFHGFVVGEINRAVASAKSNATITIDPQSIAKQVVELLEEQNNLKHAVPDLPQEAIEQKEPETPESREVSASYLQPPMWWLPLMIFSLCVVIFACAYYLFACFLLAFVPAPEQCLTPRLEASETFHRHNVKFQEAKRGRRVVDQVL
ncbi:unnamed protein product [Phytomonas sp. Hart1]|nr:unnamed protein product [Phytomonas sp. Hart1]|eukprot:CCW66757.1 unnamed protein product [Phytomonas sp. isolate Hart1]